MFKLLLSFPTKIGESLKFFRYLEAHIHLLFNTYRLLRCTRDLHKANHHLFFFLRFYLSVFREGKASQKEKCQFVVAFRETPTGDLAHNPGMCPSLGIEPVTPFGSQAGTQSTEPHQPEQEASLLSREDFWFSLYKQCILSKFSFNA